MPRIRKKLKKWPKFSNFCSINLGAPWYFSNFFSDNTSNNLIKATPSWISIVKLRIVISRQASCELIQVITICVVRVSFCMCYYSMIYLLMLLVSWFSSVFSLIQVLTCIRYQVLCDNVIPFVGLEATQQVKLLLRRSSELLLLAWRFVSTVASSQEKHFVVRLVLFSADRQWHLRWA